MRATKFRETPAVVIAGRDGVLIAQNKAARRMMGPGTGKYCWDVVGKLEGAEALPCRRGCVGELLACGVDSSSQVRFELKGKRHHISCIPVNGVVVSMLGTVSSEAPNALQSLSARERQVLRLVANGDNTSSVATRLGISESTVRTHVEKMRSKLGVNTRAAVVAEGFRLGYLD